MTKSQEIKMVQFQLENTKIVLCFCKLEKLEKKT